MVTARKISPTSLSEKRFSVCTIVSKPDDYAALQQSFEAAGFGEHCCEYLYIDNSRLNQCDAFQGLNRLLQEATGKYIILCHQDVRLHDQNIDDLNRAIDVVTSQDPNWAVLGNAGGVSPGEIAIRITDHNVVDASLGQFPARVNAVDENFMVVKRSANLSLSGDLEGFHFYGTDLCIVADVLGYSSYVIDFHLQHIGGECRIKDGSSSFHTSYPLIRQALIRKYERAFRSRWVQNTGTLLHLSGSPLKQKLFSGRLGLKLRMIISKVSGKNTSRELEDLASAVEPAVVSSERRAA